MSGISVLCHLLHLSSTSYLVSPTYHKAVLKSSVSYLCCLYSTDPMLCGDRAVSGLGVGKSPAACPGSASWRASEEQSSLILEKKAQTLGTGIQEIVLLIYAKITEFYFTEAFEDQSIAVK